MSDRIVETCGCGARVDLPDVYRGQLAEFREAHVACRGGAAQAALNELVGAMDSPAIGIAHARRVEAAMTEARKRITVET